MSDQKEQPNPYNSRNHESSEPLGRDDVMAVASLFGQVAGSLNEIDKQNLGGESQHIMAKKIDPKTALINFVGESKNNTLPVQQAAPPQHAAAIPQALPPQAISPPVTPQPVQGVDNSAELEKRVAALEKIVQTYKNIVKFKRGVSYTVTTSKMTGTFKDVEMILDIVTTELAKQTKSITIKLNDSTKNKQ